MIKFNDVVENWEIVVHCKTLEQALKLLSFAHKKGLKWLSGHSYLVMNNYSAYESNTCYYLHGGEYADCDYYKEQGYKIITVDDIDFVDNSDKVTVKDEHFTSIKDNIAVDEELEYILAELKRIKKEKPNLDYLTFRKEVEALIKSESKIFAEEDKRLKMSDDDLNRKFTI
jgi:hypothetical protein